MLPLAEGTDNIRPLAVAQILDNLLKLMQDSEFRIMASEFSTSTEEQWALSGFQFRILDSEFSNLFTGASRRGCASVPDYG